MRQLFDAVLPMQGQERKQFYNQASTGPVVGRSIGVRHARLRLGRRPRGRERLRSRLATAMGLFDEKQRFYRR